MNLARMRQISERLRRADGAIGEGMRVSPDMIELLAIHREMFRRLVACDRELSPAMAELFKEIGHCYADLAQAIERRMAIADGARNGSILLFRKPPLKGVTGRGKRKARRAAGDSKPRNTGRKPSKGLTGRPD